eukprot:792035-Amphidinium_carterae.1
MDMHVKPERSAQDPPSLLSRLQVPDVLMSAYHPTAIHYKINSPNPQTGKKYRNEFPKAENQTKI